MNALRRRLDFLLAQAPRGYAWVLARRRRHNAEKLLFLRLVRRGDVVIDGGANHGYYTLLFSHVVGRRGEVHAFEPAPPNLARLREALAEEAVFGNVVVNPWALGAAAGEGEILVPGEDGGQASLAAHRAGSWSAAGQVHRHPCRIVTLDDYCRRPGGAAPTFVKLDLEGAELAALRGAAATLDACSPLLYVEVHRPWMLDFGYGPADLAGFLLERGYRRFFLLAQEPRPVGDLTADLLGLEGSANLLCARPGRHDRRLARALSPWLGRARAAA